MELHDFTKEELQAEIQRRKMAELPQPIDNPDWDKVKLLCKAVVTESGLRDGYCKSLEYKVFRAAMIALYKLDILDFIDYRDNC